MAQPSPSAPPPPPPYQQPGYGPPSGQAPYPQPQAYYPPPPPPPPKSRTWLYVVIIVVVVVVVVLVALAALGLFLVSAISHSVVTVTVVPSGTVWNLDAGYYEEVGPVDLTSHSSWATSGTFTATNGIAAYIMDSSQYSAWGGSGNPTTYFWTSGTGVDTGSISTILSADTYYFVWLNTNLITSSSVTITSNVQATST